MIELYKHIEVLLLENDCVIVPGLGGFIAHYRPATCRADGQFLPPMRSIGFNPQLVMNDGLLVQSYMQIYNTDFPDATRKIEKAVTQLKDELYSKGQVGFGAVGTLYYNMNGAYEFAPSSEGFFTPSLYGLCGFQMEAVAADAALGTADRMSPAAAGTTAPDCTAAPARAAGSFTRTAAAARGEAEERPSSATLRRRPLHRWWQNAAAAVAAVLLFFILSVPAENTYIEETNYASLGSASLFEAIRSQSMASTIKVLREEADQDNRQRVRNNVNTLKPVTVKTERVAPPAAQRTVGSQTVTGKEGTASPTEAPKGTTPKAAAPKETAPKETSPKAEAPKETTPKAAAPKENTPKPTTQQPAATKPAAEKPVTGKPAADRPAAGKATAPGHYVIVASLASLVDAQCEAERLMKSGYPHAQVVTKDGKFRVATGRYDQSAAAYRQVEELKKDNRFSAAWVLNVR